MVAKRLSHNGRRRTTGKSTAASPRASQRRTSESTRDPLRSLSESVAELRDQIKGLAQVKIDQVDVAVRSRATKIPFYAVLGVIALALAGAAAGFILYAAALGVTHLVGDRPWLGFLLTGVFVLAVFLGATYALQIRARKRNLRRLEEKYAETHP